MAERVVKVRLTAEVNSYLKAMDDVAKKTREGRTEAKQLAAKLDAQRQAFTAVGRGMVVAGGLVAAGLVLATKRAADFDQAMSNVQAATHESAENMGLLREAALEAGASTVYSAQEAAGAIEELAKAGLSTQAIIGGGLTGALNLAAAGGLDVSKAAGVASTTLQQFNLKGDKASHVADVLAAGAGKAMGDVSDLGMALGQSGTVASQFGLSLEETTGSLAAFASKGLLGSDAGTSFRAMLLRLANPTGEAADKMKELGIQAYDAQGNFVGMTGLAGQLEKGLADLTDEQRSAALAIIFGQDAIRSANILYEEGAKGIADWTSKVDDAGYAAETAEKRLDNLNGDLEKLSGAFDTALIGLGQSGQGPLRVAVQGITDLVDGFNGMPEGGQVAVYWIGAAAAAAALAGGAFLIAVPKVAAYRVAIDDLGPAAQRASRALGALARVGAIGAVATTAVVGVDALADALSKNLLPSAEQIDNKMRNAKSGVELFQAALNKEGISNTQQAASLLKNLGAELDAVAKSDFWHPASTSGTAVTVANQLADIANSGDMATFSAQFRKLGDDAGLTERQMRTFIAANPELEAALSAQATEAGLAADRQTLLEIALGQSTPKVKSSADAFQEQADKVEGVRQAMQDLFDQVNAQNSLEQQAIQANADWVQGLADVAAQAEETGTSLDQATVSGSANAAMFAGLAADAIAATDAQRQADEATLGVDGAARKAIESLGLQRQKFEEAAVAAGFNADEVRILAEKIFAVPNEWQTKMLVETASATSAIDQWIKSFKGRTITFSAEVTGLKNPVGTGTVLLPGRASGGILPGAPSNTDNMLAAVASGEFIVRASQTAIPENRRVLEYINAGGRIPHFSNGGFVQPQYASSGGGSFSAAPITIAPVIHAAPGMDENAIADKVVRKIERKLR